MATGKNPAGQLEFNLGIDSTDFQRGAKQATRSLEQIQGAMKDANSRLKDLQAAFAQASATAVQAGQKMDKAISQEFRGGIAQARADVAKLNAELAKVGDGPGVARGGFFGGIGAALGPLTAAFSGVAVAYAAFSQAVRISNLADSLGDIADATGNSVGSLRTLQETLVAAGGSVQDMEKFATKFSQSVGEAANGNEKFIETFKQLKVPIKDATGAMRDQDAIMQDAIAALAAIENPAQRAALAVDLFGKSAAKLDFTKLSVSRNVDIEGDVAKINALRTEIEKLGLFIDNVLIKTFGALAKAINDAFPSNTTARVERLTKAISDMEAKASKQGGLGFGDKKSLDLWRSQLDAIQSEQKQVAENASEIARLQNKTKAASAGPVKDFQYGTAKKKAKEQDPAANLFGDVETQAKRDLLMVQRAFDEFQNLYRQNLVGLEEYYKNAEDLIKRQVEIETDAFNQRQALLQKELGRGDLSEKEKQKVQKEIDAAAKANADTQYQLGLKLVKNEQDRVAALEKYKDGIKEINLALLESQGLGDSQEAQLIRMEQIAAKYAEQLKQALISQDEVGANAIQRMIALQQAASNVAAIAAQLPGALSQNVVQQATVQAQGDTGQITQMEMQKRLNELKQEEIRLRIANIEAQRAEAQVGTTTYNKLTQDLMLLQIELGKLQPRMIDLGMTARQTFENELEATLSSVIMRTKSAGDAFKELGRTILASIANAAVKNAIASLFGAFGGSSAGMFGSIGKLFGFADGGIVPKVAGANNGPRADGVLARLSPGEVVLNNKAADFYGRGLLDKLNSLAIPKNAFAGMSFNAPRISRNNHLADGGVVGSSASMPVSVNIQNSGQPKDVQATSQQTPEGLVVSILMKDIQSNGPITQGLNSQSRIRR